MKISILAIEQCMISSVLGPLDIFSMAKFYGKEVESTDATPRFELEVISRDGKPVKSFNSITIPPARSMHESDDADLIFIPAIIPPVAPILDTHRDVVTWLQIRHADGTILASVCTGACLLAETGILNGKMATTHWRSASFFRERYPDVILKPQRMIVDEGDILSAGGAYSFTDLSLYIIERYTTPEFSALCAKVMVIDPGRASQSPYMIFDHQKSHGDVEILKAQAWLETHFDESFHIDNVAEAIGMGARNFKRRFKKATGDTPQQYLQRLRIEEAKRKLETTKESVDDITYQIGYEDSSSFRRLFKKITGLSPGAYRGKFSKMVVFDES